MKTNTFKNTLFIIFIYYYYYDKMISRAFSIYSVKDIIVIIALPYLVEHKHKRDQFIAICKRNIRMFA